MDIQERRSSAPTSTMLVHAVLVGLTPLIPVPILDDYVKGVVERRLVSSVGAARGVRLSDADVRALVDSRESFVGGVAKSIVTFPFKLVFRKIFFVLELKRASDGASLAYHRAHLVDRACDLGLLGGPSGRDVRAVRDALDAACGAVSVSPLAGAISTAFEASAGALDAIGRELAARIAKARGKLDDDFARGAAARAEVERDFFSKLEGAVAAVPREHFQALERAFDEALGRA